MAILNNFTRGGQLAMHRFRMVKQITWITCAISILFFCLFISLKSSSHLKSYDFYLLNEYLYADIFEAMSTTSEKRPLRNFELPNGSIIKVTTRDIIRNPILKNRVDTLISIILSYVKMAGLFAILSFFITIIFFIIRGKQQAEKKMERGAVLALPKVLRHKIIKQKLDSDLYLEEIPLIKDKETSHMLITGTTGSGKSNCFNTLLPQVRNRNQRALIVDLTGDFVAKYYNPDKDIILNPFDSRSENWCIWDECETEFQFDSFAEACLTRGSLSDTYWDNAASKVLSAALIKAKTEGNLSIKELYRILTQSSLDEYYEYFLDTDAASFTDRNGEKTTLSIRSHLASQIDFLKYIEDRKEGFSIKNWIQNDNEEGEWLFLTARADQRATLRPFISALINNGINSLMSINPDTERRVWFILDELPALQKLPSLGTGLAELRKYGGCIIAGVQSTPQLTDIYGNALSNSILDLFNTRVFFRSSDPNTTSWISRVLGEVETKETQENLSYGANTIRDGVSLSTMDKKKQLVLATEISNLEDLECYIKLPGNFPVTKLMMSYKNLPNKEKSFKEKVIKVVPIMKLVVNQTSNKADDAKPSKTYKSTQSPKTSAADKPNKNRRTDKSTKVTKAHKTTKAVKPNKILKKAKKTVKGSVLKDI